MGPLPAQPISGASPQYESIPHSSGSALRQFGLACPGAVRTARGPGFPTPLRPAPVVAGEFCGDPDLRGFLLQSGQLDPSGPGRGRNGGHQAGKSIKDVYVYALVHHFQGRVGVQPPTVVALSVESGLDGPGWAEQEFGDCELGDERLTQRLVKMVCDQAAQTSGLLCPSDGRPAPRPQRLLSLPE